MLGKSVVSERHPLYLGVYEGAMGRESVRRYVEESDCVILLGTFMTDINLGIYTAHLDPSKCIYVTSEKLRIQHHHFHDVLLADFVKRLAKSEIKARRQDASRAARRPNASHSFAKPDQKITIKRLFQRINETLGDNMVVVADVGDSLFAASDLTIHRPHRVSCARLLHVDGLRACRRRLACRRPTPNCGPSCWSATEPSR